MVPATKFDDQLRAALPADWPEVGLLLAVSGGADSVAMLRAAAALQRPLTAQLAVAHFNHRLRGRESQADERFVVALCQLLGLDCSVGQAPQGIEEGEAGARKARYDFLQQTAERLGTRYLATAHTADDQAETILHHMLRGTGLAGLAGMPWLRPLGPAVTLVRPMLNRTRAEVLAYVAALDQPYREDQSNRDLKFTRNRIRHELLPLLKRDYSPSVVDSLSRLGVLAGEVQQMIEARACQVLQDSVIDGVPHRVTLDARKLAVEDVHVVREALVLLWRSQGWPLGSMGFDEWRLLAEMAIEPDSPARPKTRKRVFPGAITAHRRGNQLVLSVAT